MTATVAEMSVLAQLPSDGGEVIAYSIKGGSLRAAVRVSGGYVQPLPDGGWGVRPNLDRPARPLNSDEVRTVRELLDLAGFRAGTALLPILEGQAGLLDLGDPDLFRRYKPAELLAESHDFAWLIKGLLASQTYGQLAGSMKSLKSYVAEFIAAGTASAQPIFGRFTPAEARPVLMYVGEGGRGPLTRRLVRICDSMGVRLADLPIEVVTETAPVLSDRFQRSIARDLAEVRPGLVIIDPLYAYHGANTKAWDLHEEGALLGAISRPCVEAGACPIVVNHMNQTGSGLDLRRITMAGSGEWVDSWILLGHREAPDVDAGRFRLTMVVGSRQWGGSTWDLDLDIGRFDTDQASHDGPISWHLQPAGGRASADAKPAVAKARQRILDYLTDDPWATKTAIGKAVGGNQDAWRQAFDDLADQGRIIHDKRGQTENGITKTRTCWAIATNPDQPDGTGSPIGDPENAP